MFIFYVAEYAYGESAGPFSVFGWEHEWPAFRFRSNESCWMVPGTVEEDV